MTTAKRLAAATDPEFAAESAGLRYVSDEEPGIRRVRVRGGFRYVGTDGRPLRDARTLARIRSLAIPPAYENVWICPRADGHIQATGRDARGRKQYRYHPRWREVRDGAKFGRMVAFGKALPRIRAAVDQDLARPGLPREKVLASVVRLLERTHIRVGNEEYAKQNGSFGLTTMRDHHARIDGATMRFRFRGKSGVRHAVDLTDRRLARVVQRCQDLPGQELFQYIDDDDDGAPRPITSQDVNEYLKAIAGEEFTAKDFRTWAGTVHAATALGACAVFESLARARQNVVSAIAAVAARLGNTRAVCRKCYIHPAVFEAYLSGTLPAVPAEDPSASESTVLRFLRTMDAPGGNASGRGGVPPRPAKATR